VKVDNVPIVVTLSIVNTNNRELLRKCLDTIRDTVKRTTHEIIVVDNASDDGSVEMMHAQYQHVRVIRNPTREGYGNSHNHAIREARGKYILVLNEDMEMLRGAIDDIVERADEIRDLGVLGCRILNPDLSLQHSCFRFPTLGQELFEAVFPYTLVLGNSRFRSKMYSWPHDTSRDVDIVLGCCMLLPRSAIERVGSFDPSFFVYSEEHDLCKRMKNAGLRVVFTPDAEMIHVGGQTSKRMSLRMALVQLDSRMKFFRKHYGALQTSLFRFIVGLGASIRGFGWGARLLFGGRSDTGAEAKLIEYWASVKFIATWKQ
jgi:GT2 family glycosyltransferase